MSLKDSLMLALILLCATGLIVTSWVIVGGAFASVVYLVAKAVGVSLSLKDCVTAGVAATTVTTLAAWIKGK